jgi:hypothetical protein
MLAPSMRLSQKVNTSFPIVEEEEEEEDDVAADE